MTTETTSPRLTSPIGAALASKKLTLPCLVPGPAFISPVETAWMSASEDTWKAVTIEDLSVYADASWRGVRKVHGERCDVFALASGFLAQPMRKTTKLGSLTAMNLAQVRVTPSVLQLLADQVQKAQHDKVLADRILAYQGQGSVADLLPAVTQGYAVWQVLRLAEVAQAALERDAEGRGGYVS